MKCKQIINVLSCPDTAAHGQLLVVSQSSVAAISHTPRTVQRRFDWSRQQQHWP